MVLSKNGKYLPYASMGKVLRVMELGEGKVGFCWIAKKSAGSKVLGLVETTSICSVGMMKG
jgi:hypothetical protein